MEKTEKIEKVRKRKKRITAAVDFCKTAAIYLLTASMLTVAGFYINERQNAGQASEIPWEKMRVFESGGTALAEINENHINPVQITVTAGGNSFTAVYNDNVIDIYEDFKYSVRGIFDRASECIKLSREEGEELWRKCTEKENSVYIKYAGNYIYPVMYIFLDKTRDVRNAADAFSGEIEFAAVRELFILDEVPVYGVAGVAKDIYGNIAVFKPEPETAGIIRSRINNRRLAAYNDNERTGVIPCEFLKGEDISAKTGINKNNITNLKFHESFHLFYNYNTYSSVLKFSNPLLDENGKIDTEQSFIKDLFKILNVNTEISGPPYSDSRGITFVDGKNTVKFFYTGGQIVYNGSIHLSKFLGYDTDYYTFYEKIKAASVFAGSLAGGITGNACSLYLKNITADSDENLKIVFSYYYEGTEIKINGSDEGIVVGINESGITEATVSSLYVSSDDMIKNRNPILDLSVIDDMISADINNDIDREEISRKYKLGYDKIQDKFLVNKFELIYNIDYTDGNNDSVTAAWEIR